MFSKANIISTIICAIWGMAGGFLLWGIIGDPLLKEQVLIDGLMKEPLDVLHLALGTLIQAFGFSAIYSKYGHGNYSAKTGLGMGLLTGVMIGCGEKLIDFATANMMTIQGTLGNALIYLVFFGITGLLAGLVYKKFAN